MESNFEFLNDNIDTHLLYDASKNAEELYVLGKFSDEFVSMRKIIEKVVLMILDLNYVDVGEYNSLNDNLKILKQKNLVSEEILNSFYQLKSLGNSAAHTLKKYSKSDALGGLKKLYSVLMWFANTYCDGHEKVTNFVEPQHSNLYQTAERKLIYIETGDNTDGKWPAYNGLEKVGDATIDDYEMDNKPNSPDLRKVANHRIKQYMGTAGVPYKLGWAELAYRKFDNSWFRDYDVHEVLLRSGIKKKEMGTGQEWFETDLETAKQAIKAVKEGKKSIDAPSSNSLKVNIVLRPEQKDAVKKTERAFKKHDEMLWNAKMRFGKTISALQLVKDEQYKHVLIMTHRPVVDDGWFNDFKKLNMAEAGYLYGSKKEGEDFDYLSNSDKPFIYFASLQDLRGSEIVGGTAGDKNRKLFSTNWDLVIIDEAHEGTQTELAQKVTSLVVKKGYTKLLELSGTPFNILDQYNEDTTYTWDYVMEQQAKYTWNELHPNEPNPYDGLPKVSMFTFEMNRKLKDEIFLDENNSFNFKEFFRVNQNGKFIYEDKVRHFLDNITQPDKNTNYPFSTKEFRERLRHTLWILPGVKEANALEILLKDHPVFGMDYKVVNVVRNGDDNGITYESDIKQVNDAMGPDPAETKTITLTVRKLTTGVTIKPWTGVLFLSNTNSAMQYLQAAFRAQTPYSSPTFGKKTNCYIFDFAPDRALKIMAASTRLNTGVGKLTSSVQKTKMNELLNFLPIIGESGQGMKPYKVDSLLAKIKRVYAEKAVRTGFDDDSLYSDALLLLKEKDLDDFNGLKAIVGTTKAEKKPFKVNVNNQGLDQEEYDRAIQGKKKPKRQRTAQEQAALDKVKELKKQRKTMISILRSISIRIPMMIYGMNVKLDEDVNINKFTSQVDDKSWEEFMPKGVTKELFRKFSKYYDQDVFIEAGKIIRQRVKKLDTEDPIDRVEHLAEIFGTFHNPDKETVLTPWKVVNMQLGMTLGGYCFYDNQYKYTTFEGKRANHWINTKYTDKILSKDSHILEINAKTGLYPLYAAMSIYWREYQKLNNDAAGKFSLEDELMIWQRVLRENIFVIAKTPMAAAIAQRTLVGYHDMDVNIEFVDNIVEDSKKDVEEEAKKIERLFNNMKFDVVIGNPPYQSEANGESTRDEPIYQNFMELSYRLADLVILITPARFLFDAGQTPKTWNKKMLNDQHLKVVKYERDSNLVFPRTDIKGGVVITLWDKNKNYKPIGIFTSMPKMNSIWNKVKTKKSFDSMSKIVSSQGLYRFSKKALEQNSDILKNTGKGTGSKITSKLFSLLNNIFISQKKAKYLKVIGRTDGRRVYKYIEPSLVEYNNYINKFKLLIPKSNGSGTFGETISNPIIGIPNLISTDTFISIGPVKNEFEANALLKYVKTKFLRAMLGIKKATQDNPRSTWRMVPLQDFTQNSDINWTKSVSDIDQQLYKKYDLSDDEINFIETKVQAME